MGRVPSEQVPGLGVREHTHFVGIGGAGMSSLAAILLEAGQAVSGCDRAPNEQCRLLAEKGATVYEGHSAAHLEGVTRVVCTRASSRNEEVALARERGLPVLDRGELVGRWMDRRRGIAVAGTKGKTTTTAAIAALLVAGGLDPTVYVGGVPAGWTFGGRLGRGEWLVAEGDEFNRAFLHLHSEISVLTGIEMDHPDIYPSLESLTDAFAEYLAGTREGGVVIAYAGNERGLEVARKVADERGLRLETYGRTPGASWLAVPSERDRNMTVFDVRRGDQVIEGLSTCLPGGYNLDNLTAAVAAASLAGVGADSIRRALAEFRGVARRFEMKGARAGVTVVDDYAHHPIALEALFAAARERYPGLALWAAFQPHTYSRTRVLMGEFAWALALPDRTYLLDVYAAREEPIPGVCSKELARLAGPKVVYSGGVAESARRIAADLRPGTLLLTVGAGDVTLLGPMVLDLLEEGE